MTNLATRTYCPRSGSIPAKAIAYFSKNLSARCTQGELAMLLGVSTDGFATNLATAIEAGFIARNNGIYTAGEDIDQAPDYSSLNQTNATIAAAGSTQAAHSPFAMAPAYKARVTAAKRAQISSINFDAFVIEDNVPMVGGTRGCEKWAPLLDRLVKAGQSAVIDPAMKPAISAAAKSRQKKGVGKYKAGTDLQGNTRLWRIE